MSLFNARSMREAHRDVRQLEGDHRLLYPPRFALQVHIGFGPNHFGIHGIENDNMERQWNRITMVMNLAALCCALEEQVDTVIHRSRRNRRNQYTWSMRESKQAEISKYHRIRRKRNLCAAIRSIYSKGTRGPHVRRRLPRLNDVIDVVIFDDTQHDEGSYDKKMAYSFLNVGRTQAANREPKGRQAPDDDMCQAGGVCHQHTSHCEEGLP